MDLTDIFGDDATTPKPTAKPVVAPPAPGIAGLPETVVATARAAAEAHDAAVAAEAEYKLEEARLKEELGKRLAELDARRKGAREFLDEALDALLTTMDKEKISKIPMADRPDILVKVSPGKKKSITKKWLIETYGSDEAKRIWDAVPTSESKREVIVPDRYDDEPEPY